MYFVILSAYFVILSAYFVILSAHFYTIRSLVMTSYDKDLLFFHFQTLGRCNLATHHLFDLTWSLGNYIDGSRSSRFRLFADQKTGENSFILI